MCPALRTLTSVCVGQRDSVSDIPAQTVATATGEKVRDYDGSVHP